MSFLKEGINENNGNSIGKIFTSLASHFGDKEGGTISNLIGGAAGLVKESLLSRLSDRVIIIDDLDRLNEPTLQSSIVGECLHLATNKESNLQFLFVVNDEKVELNELKEKAFSGVVKLNHTVSDIVDIAFKKYEWAHSESLSIVDLLSKLKFKNIRILKRVAKKINDVSEVIKSDDELSYEQSISLIIKNEIVVSYHHNVKKLSEQELYEEANPFNIMERDEDKYPLLIDVHANSTPKCTTR
tara:strand:+ start:269 stop:997 length:729 start_codon:yes stop_codon:yes gene_type:complete